MTLFPVLTKVRTPKLLALALLSLSLATFASAQSASMLVDIPFAFRDTSHSFPAGHYRIQCKGDNMVLVQNTNADWLGFSMTQGELRAKAADIGKLVFHQYGDQYFLSDIWMTDRTLGRQVLMGRIEKHLRERLAGQPYPGSQIALNQQKP